MSVLEELQARSGNQCELCGATESLQVYEVPLCPPVAWMEVFWAVPPVSHKLRTPTVQTPIIGAA